MFAEKVRYIVVDDTWVRWQNVTGEKECEDLTVLKWISVDSVIVWESGEETQ